MDKNLENIDMMITSSTINYFTTFPLALPEQTEQSFYITTNTTQQRDILSGTLVSLTNAFNIKRACCMYNTDFNRESFIEVPIRLYVDSTVDNYSTLATKFVLLDQYGYPAPLLDNNNRIIFDSLGRVVHSTTLSNVEEYTVKINKEVCKNIDNLTYNGNAEYKKSENIYESLKCDNFYLSFCRQLNSYNPYNPLINRRGLKGYSNECSCILSDKIQEIGVPYKISSLDPICTSAGTYIPKDIIETHDCYPAILPENYKRFGVDFNAGNLGFTGQALTRLTPIKYTELEKINIANKNQDLLIALYKIFEPLDYTDLVTGSFVKGFDRLSMSKNIKEVLESYKEGDPRRRIGFYFNRTTEADLINERFIRRIFKSEIFGNDINIGIETHIAIITYILQNNPNMSDIVIGQYRVDNNEPIISGTFTPPQPSERPEYKCVKNIYFGPPLPDMINYVKLPNFINDYLIILREVFNFNQIIIQDYRNIMNKFVAELPKDINYVDVNDTFKVKKEKELLDLFFSIGIPIENIADYNLRNIKKNITDVYLSSSGAERTGLKLKLNEVDRNLNKNVLSLYANVYKIKLDCILDIEKKIRAINNNSIVRRIFENDSSREFFKVIISEGNRYDLLKFFVDEFGSNYSLLDIDNILTLFSEDLGMTKNDIKKFTERIDVYRKETGLFNTIKNIINLSPKELFMYFLGLKIYTDNQRNENKHSLLHRFYLKYKNFFKIKEYTEIENKLIKQGISNPRIIHARIESSIRTQTQYGKTTINGLIYNTSDDINFIYNLYSQETGINNDELKYNKKILNYIYSNNNRDNIIHFIEYMYENYPYNITYYDFFNNPYNSLEFNRSLKQDLTKFITMSIIVILLKAKDINIDFTFKDIENILSVYGYLNNINNDTIKELLDIIKPVFSTKVLQYKYLFNYDKDTFTGYNKFARIITGNISTWGSITEYRSRNLSIRFSNATNENSIFSITKPFTSDFNIDYDEIYGSSGNYTIYQQYNNAPLTINTIRSSNELREGVKKIIDEILITEILYYNESDILKYKMTNGNTTDSATKLNVGSLGFLTPVVSGNNLRFTFSRQNNTSFTRDFKIDESSIDNKFDDIKESIITFNENNFIRPQNDNTVRGIIRDTYLRAFSTLSVGNAFSSDIQSMLTTFYNGINVNKHNVDGLTLGDVFKFVNKDLVIDWYIDTHIPENSIQTSRLNAFTFMKNNQNTYNIPQTNPIITKMFNINFNNNEIANTTNKLRSTTVIGTSETDKKKYLICKLIYSKIPSGDLISLFNIAKKYLGWFNTTDVITLVRYIELARSYENYISNIFNNKFSRYNDYLNPDVQLPIFNLAKPDFSIGFSFSDSETTQFEQINRIEPFTNINIVENFIVGKIVGRVTKPVQSTMRSVGNTVTRNVVSPVRSTINTVGNKVISTLDPVIGSVKTELEKIFGTIIETLKNEVFDKLTSEVSGLFNRIVNEVKVPLESLFNSLKDNLGTLIVQPLLNIISGVSSNILKELSKVFSGIVGSLSSVIKDVTGTIFDQLGSVTSLIMDSIGDVLDAIDFDSLLGTITNLLTDSLGDIFNSLSDIFGDLLETLTDILISIFDSLLPVISQIFEKVITIFIDILEPIMGKLLDIAQGLLATVLPLLEGLFWNIVNTFIIPGLYRLYEFLLTLWNQLNIPGIIRGLFERFLCPILNRLHPEFCDKLFNGKFMELLQDLSLGLFNDYIKPIWNNYLAPKFWELYDWAKEKLYDNIIWLWNNYGVPAVSWVKDNIKRYTCIAIKTLSQYVYPEYGELSCDVIYSKLITKVKWSGIVLSSGVVGGLIILLTLATLFGSFVLSIFN